MSTGTSSVQLVERGRRIVDTVAARVPGAVVKDEGWAWRIVVHGRGYCLLRRDTRWACLSSGSAVDFFDDFHQPLSEYVMIDKLTALMEQFPPAINQPPSQTVVHSIPSVTPVVTRLTRPTTTPMMSVTPPITPTRTINLLDPSASPMDVEHVQPIQPMDIAIDDDNIITSSTRPPRTPGKIRMAEINRLKADGRVFSHYKV